MENSYVIWSVCFYSGTIVFWGRDEVVRIQAKPKFTIDDSRSTGKTTKKALIVFCAKISYTHLMAVAIIDSID